MVRRWLRLREEGWWWRMAVNGLGALTTGIVMLTIAGTKFMEGAWIVVLLIPLLVLTFMTMHRHYDEVATQLSLDALEPPPPLQNTVLVLVGDLHRGVVKALQYAQTLSVNAKAVFVELDPDRTHRLEQKWAKWGMGLPLIVLTSPYRSLLGPLLHYVDHILEQGGENQIVTIVLPEFIPARWWQHLLHNQTALLIKGASFTAASRSHTEGMKTLTPDGVEVGCRKVIVTDVPYHLRH